MLLPRLERLQTCSAFQRLFENLRVLSEGFRYCPRPTYRVAISRIACTLCSAPPARSCASLSVLFPAKGAESHEGMDSDAEAEAQNLEFVLNTAGGCTTARTSTSLDGYEFNLAEGQVITQAFRIFASRSSGFQAFRARTNRCWGLGHH